jgi:very-short-patch-repair endonuclease
MDHSRLDRQLIRNYLLKLVQAVTSAVAKGRSYEEQFAWLMEKHDPKSGLEAELLQLLFESRRRLPDRAQYRPEPGIYCEADFYCERDGLKGVAIFVDGPSHDEPTQRKKDAEERTKLDNLGYRVLVIRYDRSIEQQIAENPDVFGPGAKAAS